jgi:hypothetical protein
MELHTFFEHHLNIIIEPSFFSQLPMLLALFFLRTEDSVLKDG